MNAQELQDLYGWVDFFHPFTYEQTDPATADAMTILIVFNGLGDTLATEAHIESIQLFASDLFARVAQPGRKVHQPLSDPNRMAPLLTFPAF